MPSRGLLSLLATLALGASGVPAADAPVPSIGRDTRTDVAVTVYTEDLGLVKDTRRFAIAAGESVIRFEDVAAKIDPRTVAIRSITEPDRLAVIEQNYVFDLISPATLMEKYVGHEVELVETDQQLQTRTTKATLLSTNDGYVYRIGDGIAVGHPGRVVLPQLPEELYARPTLLWRLGNSGAATHTVEVSYLTAGLGWTADYVLVVSADDATGTLGGWVTLTNRSGARYDDANVKLVAGRINRATPPERLRPMEAQMARAAPTFAEEAFFEYHLYSLDRRTTIAENENKQMRLLGADGVQLKKRYVLVGKPAWYRSRVGDLGRDLPVGVVLEFENTAANHLGMPLPAGTVRLYKQDKSGAEQLIGEDRIGHTPKDEKVTLEAGDAFDVVATRTQTDYRVIDVKPYDAEAAFAVTLRNHKPEPVTVTLREPVGGEWAVVASSVPPVHVDAGTLGFEVVVPANGETALTYRLRVGH
jgi:hypothetical protein